MDIFVLAESSRVRANVSWGDTPRSKHIYFPGKVAARPGGIMCVILCTNGVFAFVALHSLFCVRTHRRCSARHEHSHEQTRAAPV